MKQWLQQHLGFPAQIGWEQVLWGPGQVNAFCQESKGQAETLYEAGLRSKRMSAGWYESVSLLQHAGPRDTFLVIDSHRFHCQKKALHDKRNQWAGRKHGWIVFCSYLFLGTCPTKWPACQSGKEMLLLCAGLLASFNHTRSVAQTSSSLVAPWVLPQSVDFEEATQSSVLKGLIGAAS